MKLRLNAREEDAARAYDRVNIAKLGHAKAKTNFSVAEYRAEWGQLEALGVDGAVALVRKQAALMKEQAAPKRKNRYDSKEPEPKRRQQM